MESKFNNILIKFDDFFKYRELFKNEELPEEVIFQEYYLKKNIKNIQKEQNRIFQHNLCLYKLLLDNKKMRSVLESFLDEIEIKIKFIYLIDKLLLILDMLTKDNWILIDSILKNIKTINEDNMQMICFKLDKFEVLINKLSELSYNL